MENRKLYYSQVGRSGVWNSKLKKIMSQVNGNLMQRSFALNEIRQAVCITDAVAKKNANLEKQRHSSNIHSNTGNNTTQRNQDI